MHPAFKRLKLSVVTCYYFIGRAFWNWPMAMRVEPLVRIISTVFNIYAALLALQNSKDQEMATTQLNVLGR